MEAETQHHRSPLPALRHQVDEHDLVNAFLSGKSPRTIQAYTRDLDDFRTFLGARTTQEAATTLLSHGPGSANATALSYRTHLQDRHLSSSTINRRLAALRSLVKLARTFGIINYSLDVPNVRSTPYRDTRGPGKTGVKNLITQLDTDHTPRGIRDKALLRLLYDLALRRGEVAGLDLSDVDLTNRKITIIGKGYTDKQTLSLPEPTVEALQRWIEVRGTQPPGPLFTNFDRAGKGSRLTGTSIYRIVREHGTKVGINKLRPHGLRHTAITEAVKVAEANGYTLDEVRDFSRHRSVRTLMIYRDRDRDAQLGISSLVAANF